MRRLAYLLVPLLLAVAGCTATADEPERPAPATRAERPSPFADCAPLTVVPAAAAPTPAGKAGDQLPDLTLNCFTGGAPVNLRDVKGPAVINVWASWCPPCRKELPAFQRLSERADGRFQVIGVNSRDSRGGAQSIGEDYGVGFPMLLDQGDAFQRALERNAFPLTVLVDADGRIRHTDATGALDDARLAALLQRHLGVKV
ncbi:MULTISPECIES: TlpA family protein disulfide reductase [Micromonospora]|uniref:TlpA family protein disulfide reductase n=2 Tax=Micromonospora TaxID=1873 RepID=A0ABX9Y701_MICCH|nr:thiol-disulfide isomerase/thioredoxin [Micromonospora sp. HB375]MDH6471753.1 thiol-disulfide isomerase/thioredoxin [Micromonospora sp. H404/HB375]NHO84460.1 TlpA family protein disulfide reductase [Micromonospora sp. CMU55-4]ODB79333.1 alkyl hydroperoxide reductase [Micromonospora sp. II]RBQ07457.1 TlpA family protein disulfide reductase [Micromonospora sp. LHW51205]RQW92576.1 TlpA family protein disulfide reductase [Micromonospora chalcea]